MGLGTPKARGGGGIGGGPTAQVRREGRTEREEREAPLIPPCQKARHLLESERFPGQFRQIVLPQHAEPISSTTLCPKVHVTSKPPLFSGIDAHIMKSFEVLNPQTGRFNLVYHTW